MINSRSLHQSLFEIYQHSEIQNNVLDINEIQGFICAIAVFPDALELQDWFPCLWMQGRDPSFSSVILATDFASAVLQVYERVLMGYQEGHPLILSSNLWLDDLQQVTNQGCAFASGYLSGFQYVEENWNALNLLANSETQQLLQTTLLLLSKMATPNTEDLQMQALFKDLPTEKEIVNVLPQLLTTLGHCVIVENNE